MQYFRQPFARLWQNFSDAPYTVTIERKQEVLRIYVDALYLSRRQTAGVAEATLRFVDDERTVQTREDGVPN